VIECSLLQGDERDCDVMQVRGRSKNIEGGHIAWVYMYMERSNGAHTDADSYTRTQTEQSGNKTTRTVWSGNGESDRSCIVYVNEQHRYGFRLRQYVHANL